MSAPPADGWWDSAYAQWLWVAGLTAVALLLALRTLGRLRPGAGEKAGASEGGGEDGGRGAVGGALRRAGRRLAGDGGVTTVEFALVFPVVLTLILMLTQAMLLLAAQTVVHYAAYAGVRVAAVRLPEAFVAPESGLPLADDVEDRPVVFSIVEGGELYERIEDAVAAALAPVGGEISASSEDQAAADAVAEFFARAEVEAPKWVQGVYPRRLAYARDATTFSLYWVEQTDAGVWAWRLINDPDRASDPGLPVNAVVGLTLRHQLNLSVPYASAIFADGRRSVDGGEEGYTNIEARAFMPIEAIPRRSPEEPIPWRGL